MRGQREDRGVRRGEVAFWNIGAQQFAKTETCIANVSLTPADFQARLVLA